MGSRNVPAGLSAVDFETLSLTNSTAVGLNSTIRNQASVLDVSVETNSVRFRNDGTDPTLNTGVLLSTGYHRLEGYAGGANFKFQRSTGSATVSVMAYKHVGSGSRA